MKKIQLISRTLLWIFIILTIWLPISLLLFWLDAPTGLIQAHLGAGWASMLTENYLVNTPAILHTLSITTKFLGLLVCLIPLAIQLLILACLIKLFRNYSELEIFTLYNARLIKTIGWIILIGEIIRPLYQGLLSTVISWGNPEGHRYMTITFDQTNLALLLCAIMIILVSWIMSEACKEQETSKLIV